MGQAGSFRANALGASQMSAAKTHEERLDQVAKLRVKRNTPPLVYSPYSPDRHGEVTSSLHLEGENALRQILAMIAEKDAERHLSLTAAYDAHVEGARRNKGASKLCLHAFVQFPTDLKITPENERLMLAQAVDFVNRHHGGRAVFHARLDRDEAGRHGVDVFYAPKYTKATKRRSEIWVSLTRFGKEMAIKRFGRKPKEIKTDEEDPETGKPVWKAMLDASGDPIMVDCDSAYYQGQTLQDLFFEHLRDRMKLAWVQRGEKKIGRDPDRLEVEEYKLKKEQEGIQREFDETMAEAQDMARDLAAKKREAEAATQAAQKAERQAIANREEEERRAAEAKQKAADAAAAAKRADEERTAAQSAARKAREEEKKAREAVAQLEPQRAALEALNAEIEEKRSLLADLKEQAGQIMEDARKMAKDIIAKATAETRNIVVAIANQYDNFKRVSTAEKQLINREAALREAVTETLNDLGIADQETDIGEAEETGRAPSVRQLIFRRADRRAADKNKQINIPNNTPGMG